MNDDDVSVEVVLGLVDCIVYNYFVSKLSEHSEELKKRHDLAMEDFQRRVEQEKSKKTT